MRHLLSTITLSIVTAAASIIGLGIGATLWESKIEPWVDKKLNQLSLRGEKGLGGNFGSFLLFLKEEKMGPTISDYDLRIVEFGTYCKTCKHEKLKENEDPCVECLEMPYNEHTSKPVKWEEKEAKK